LHEKEAKELLDAWKNRGETVGAAPAALNRFPILAAYDHCLKCSHLFNLMDARGVISATERAALMQRVRTLSCRAAAAYLEQATGAAPKPGVRA
jgi:glycyl-tRNA synthetase alpha subunit